MELKEILFEEDFNDIKKKGNGYIAITDGNNCRMHITACPNIDLSYFKTKVIKNKRKNGSYYWSDDISTLKTKWNQIEDCLHCKHLY